MEAQVLSHTHVALLSQPQSTVTSSEGKAQDIPSLSWEMQPDRKTRVHSIYSQRKSKVLMERKRHIIWIKKVRA